MPSTPRSRIWAIATVAVLAAVALVLAYPRGASSAESVIITVSAPGSTTACMPCHPQIGESRNPDVIFDHAAHLLIQCTACHNTPAHAGGATKVPTMASCFTCHGLTHGPTGLLAGGECADCHPASFELRPVFHVKDWKAKPHAVTAKEDGVNGCLLCHESTSDCDQCHTDEDVDVGPMPIVYLSVLPEVAAEPTVTVDPSAPVTISQCVYCHTDIDDFDVEGLIFTHDPHLQRTYRCEACHPQFPHGTEGTLRPEMRKCTRCHGLEHNGAGNVATGECELCHTEDFELTPTDHTVAFLVSEHKEPALDDTAYCSQCHPAKDCVECHNGGVEMADGKKSLKVIPVDHRKPQWASEHGPLYLGQKGLCAVCHTPVSCQRCHQTTMPHPATWLALHAKGNGSLAKDCSVCHSDREFCQECHHDSVRSTALVLENCVDCHPEMQTEPATAIKVAGLAEHAVHFGVEEKKGEPYYCEDCHVGFGSGGVHVVSSATGPHDMRICYECHGALDIKNIRIAPWPGSELCLRCHTDLNI